jgi:hypothetical protein
LLPHFPSPPKILLIGKMRCAALKGKGKYKLDVAKKKKKVSGGVLTILSL